MRPCLASSLRRGALLLGAMAPVLFGPVAACSSVPVKSSYMALDSAGDRRRDAFFTDTDHIFCIAEIQGGRRGRTVNATLRASNLAGIVGNFVLAVGEEVVNQGGAVVSFELEKAATGDVPAADVPWPVGEYACEVSVEGVLFSSIPFTIGYPECPVPPAIGGSRCRGFFKEGSRCRGVDQSVTCTCGASGAWEC